MILDATRPSVFRDRYGVVAEWVEVAYGNCAKFRGEISGKARLEPGRNERVAFSAIKRDARSARRVELFRAIVRGGSERAGPRAYGVTRAEFILIPRGAKYPRLRPRCMKIYDILVRLFVLPFAREIYSMHVI